MTLTEFLLARVAEDEAQVEFVRDFIPEFGDQGEYINPARVLAECEAKRRIIEAFETERVRRDIYNRGYDDGHLTTNDDLRSRLASNAHCRGLEIALLALAQPYADHPDYRAEWKP